MYIGTTVRSPRATIEVAVLVDGQEQPLYRRPSDGKAFVAGTPGQAYTLRVRNTDYSGQIEVINTVDGRHTLDDEPGDAQRNRGLIFRGNSIGEFTGWRISDLQTRKFVFGSPDCSVAAQATGSTENVGVIGFAVHRERTWLSKFSAEDLILRGATRGGRPESFSGETTRGGNLGTGIGAVQEDRVGRTNFDRDGSDPDILVIGYDTEEVLRQQGIIAPAEANPFPGAQTGYAKYQPGS